jgi:hypothetical protein
MHKNISSCSVPLILLSKCLLLKDFFDVGKKEEEGRKPDGMRNKSSPPGCLLLSHTLEHNSRDLKEIHFNYN